MDWLFYLLVMLVMGAILIYFSNSFKIPNSLLLLLFGVFLGYLHEYDIFPFALSSNFIKVVTFVGLAMIAFDATSRFKYKNKEFISKEALHLFFFFFLLNFILTTLFFGLILNKEISTTILISIILTETVFEMKLVTKNQIVHILDKESILNTPFILLAFFVLLDFIISPNFLLLFQQIVLGIGVGILVAILIGRLFNIKSHTKTREFFSHFTLLCTAFLTFLIAELLSGDGVIAVLTLGLVFGNSYVKEEMQLQEFSTFFKDLLKIFVFIILGIVARIPLTWEFLLLTIVLYILYLGVRFLAVEVTLPHIRFPEKLFMILQMPKGITVGVIGLTLFILNLPGVNVLLQFLLAFIIISEILSIIALKNHDEFLLEKVEVPRPE